MSKKIYQYIDGIKALLNRHRNKSNAVLMKQYMRNQFEFFGIQAVERRHLCGQCIKSNPIPQGHELRKVVIQLWKQPERELHYFGIELLIKSKKQLTEKDLIFFEFLITTNSWWDTIDYLAGHVIGPWLLQFQKIKKSVTKSWNCSENIWLQRMSILFQLKYKKDTDTHLLSEYILNLRESKEFFIQKAIGWALREYSKTDQKWVIRFISSNELKPLSVREGLKVIKRKRY